MNATNRLSTGRKVEDRCGWVQVFCWAVSLLRELLMLSLILLITLITLNLLLLNDKLERCQVTILQI